jgi:glycosyltransferase involved in cell wall biosynthesis
MTGGTRIKGKIRESKDFFPLVSLITVVYNGEKYLEQTILSVLNQTYNNVEYLIIDGNSTDHSLDIIKKYTDSIDLWVSEPDNSIYEAINKGISFARGEIIGIIHSDDWYEADTVEKVVRSLMLNRNVDIIHGLHRLWEDSKILGVVGHTEQFLKSGMISHPSTFIKKSLYDKYGSYGKIYKIAGDYELMLRFKSHNVRFLFIEEILANFRNSGISNTANKKMLHEVAQIQHKYQLIKYSRLLIHNVAYYLKSLINV